MLSMSGLWERLLYMTRKPFDKPTFKKLTLWLVTLSNEKKFNIPEHFKI